MIDDLETIDLIGVGLILFIVLASAVLILAGATAPGRQPAEPPAANWTIERVDVGQVNVTHAGGEPVDASNLVVSVAGVERAPGRADVLTEGEALTIPARTDQRVALYWVGSRDERALLDEWQAP